MCMSLPDKFLKPFDAQSIEDGLYAKWLASGLFNPDVCIEKGYTKPDAESFSIVLPPPNVTGTLHTGHAFMLAIEDIMVRYNRMQGKKTLWIPGTDHAAISTESVIVKQLSKEGTTKFKIGREEFLKRVNTFAQESHDTIVGQTKKMGASLDWSREAFTLDEQRHRAVVTAFKTMYDDGLIYRGDRIVNWDPKGQTTVSDDEVDREEETSKFYYFKYGPFVIGTARPETKFGDKYVVMHPDDARFSEYAHGQKIELEWINGPMTATVIKDTAIDMEFGTGVMTITPWHSAIDFEIAEKYNLDKEQIIDMYGKLLPIAGEFAGMKIEEARAKIVEKLDAKGLLVKIEDNYKHQKAISQRTKATIEPQIMKQWWIDVNKPIAKRDNLSLKELMLRAVREDGVAIIPDRFEKIYFNWIENLRDWNISRQIWYGHQIPVWYDKENNVHLPREQKFIFTRHGESQANLDKVYAGQADSPLTTLGKEQALDTAKKLHGKNISKIISSDLSRAYDTAQIIAKELGIDNIETWKELRNMDLGNTTGTPLPDNSTSSKFTKKTMIDIGIEYSDGETLQDLEKRAHEVIKKLQKSSSEGVILIVGHGQFTRILLSVLNGDKGNQILDNQRKITIDNLQIYEKTLFLNPTGENLTQDSDTLDTWFSSGLWTFSTLGWPENTNDLKIYHPTSILETGHDIIFFWVARMILMSTYLLGEIPFKTVYMHGMVLDKNGKKMSKSNPETAIDPLLTIEKYGADALRMAMIVGVGPGQDVTLSEDKIKAYSKFANKIWNATRFVLEQTNADDLQTKPVLDQEHAEYINQWNTLSTEITKEMDEFRYYLVSEKLYHFFWHTFADIVIEKCKSDMNDSARYTLRYLLHRQLITLHPFMPFITEEIWSSLYPDGDLLMITPWKSAE
ncbi:MAG: class I tRNA ligase family protein [Candidatus Pacebacteria bacterium]|nr:class I tRNA ligase family protein [Candidatus Paceibacterota bacterium]